MELEKLIEMWLTKEISILQKLLEMEEKKQLDVCKLCPICCLGQEKILNERSSAMREEILRNREMLKDIVNKLTGLINPSGPDEMVVLVPVVIKRPFFEQDVLEIAKSGIIVDEKALKILDKYIF